MKGFWKVCLKRIGIMVALMTIMYLGAARYDQAQLAESLSEKIIRFHVRANSDSRKDQELKLSVRDAVGAYMQQELKDAESMEESRQIVLQDMDEIRKTAETAVRQQGYSYDVTASLANVEFPVKEYGTYVFPAGEYEALQIIIGEGKGKNWWCVMYPNMCFHGSVYAVVEEEAEASLQKCLTREEYDAVMKPEGRILKCKWLSFLNPLLSKE